MNPRTTITREEFERAIEELRTEMKASPSRSTVANGASPECPRAEFVHKDEFRLFKWFGGLALAAILSGMGLLYQGLAEQRVAMERQFADLRAEMHAGFRAITADVDSGITTLQHDVADVKERLARVETLLGVKNRERLPD